MHTNRLIGQKSPYLLQHAHNPVDWFPWGEEAFRKAREENKPIFLSVGYSTCHWCHVMERESFEDEKVAVILNDKFVSIKLDREERPDVDRVYMLFVQATTGSGGWPMSVWLTPELKPFFGGTYFPPDSRYGRPGFASVLEKIASAWREKRDALLSSSQEIVADLAAHTNFAATDEAVRVEAVGAAFSAFRRSFDSRNGGFGDAPKFPRPSVFNFLFRYFRATGNEEARHMAVQTLRAMARGGMCDQLGGGFHRYSVDERWFVPHFEKMLYDQAQLAVSYLEAFQITGDAELLGAAHGTLAYVMRDLTHPDGGFYSAEDADSVIDPAQPNEKGEGAFYIWKYSELVEVLGAELAARFAERYGAKPGGNVDHDPHGEFTGANILYQASGEDSLEFGEGRCKLFGRRAARVRPHLDDKILTSWNGLMISAFAKAAQVAGSERYREAALRAAGFIRSRLFDEATSRLQRRWRDGEPAVDGFLDDYAALAQAHVDLYETDFDPAHLEFASRLAHTLLELFEDKEGGGFFTNSPGDGEVILRLKDDYDGAEPAGNSLAVAALFRLARYTGESAFHDAAARAMRAFASRVNQQGFSVPHLLAAWLEESAPRSQVVIAEQDGDAAAGQFLQPLRRRFSPFTSVYVLDGRRVWLDARLPALTRMQPVNGRTAAFVCRDFTCRLPVTEVREFEGLLD
jgi:uncharacterized protein